jgi:hypothetical protein
MKGLDPYAHPGIQFTDPPPATDMTTVSKAGRRGCGAAVPVATLPLFPLHY